MIRKFGVWLLAAAVITVASALSTYCMGAAAGVASTNWEIVEWTDPVTVSVDTASIAAHAARVTARVIWDYAETQHTGGQSAALYKSMVGIVVFDCTAQRFGGAGSVSYSEDGGDGDAVAQYSINPDNATLSAPGPGTVGLDLLTFVCGYARGGLRI